MMRRKMVIGGVGVLLALCLPAQAVVLRYKPAVGTKATYKLVVSATANMDMGNGPMSIKMNGKGTFAQKVLEIQEEAYKVESTMKNLTMTFTTSGDTSRSKPEKQKDSRTVALLDTQGKVKKVLVSSDETMIPFSDNLVSGGVELPEVDLKPGDTWTYSMKAPASGMMPGMNLTLKSTLVKLITYQGRPCAVIRTEATGPLTMNAADQGVTVKGSGTLTGTSLQYYDYGKSVWLDRSIDMKITMTAKPLGKQVPSESTVTSTTKVSVKLVFQK